MGITIIFPRFPNMLTSAAEEDSSVLERRLAVEWTASGADGRPGIRR